MAHSGVFNFFGGGGILSDLRELRFCGTCGTCGPFLFFFLKLVC